MKNLSKLSSRRSPKYPNQKLRNPQSEIEAITNWVSQIEGKEFKIEKELRRMEKRNQIKWLVMGFKFPTSLSVSLLHFNGDWDSILGIGISSASRTIGIFEIGISEIFHTIIIL